MIVLDTHAWIWWVSSPRKLSARARRAIDEARTLAICPISCWEVATLVRRGRLTLDRDVPLWVKQALALPRLELSPLSPEIATVAGQLPDPFHGDPADRLIVATALSHRAPVITKDARIRESKAIPCVW